MEVVPVDKKAILNALEHRGIVAIFGMYGSGKNLIVEWIGEKLKEKKSKIVRLSFKDLPTPTDEDIATVAGYKNMIQLHHDWRDKAEKEGKRGNKLIVIIEEAQKLLENGANFWEALTSLIYYQRGCINFVISAQPAILDTSNLILQKLIRKSVIFPRILNLQETHSLVKYKQYSRAIYRLAHGHYGTVKYLDQIIGENNFTGDRLSESRVVKWAQNRGDMMYFADIIWRNLSLAQQMWVRRYVNNRGKVETKSRISQELHDCGLWYRGGKSVNWFVSWTLPFVRKYLESVPSEIVDVSSLILSGKEKILWELFCNNKGRTITYDEIWNRAWEQEEFSLWSLARAISRFRMKLNHLGLTNVIESVRGIGYQVNI